MVTILKFLFGFGGLCAIVFIIARIAYWRRKNLRRTGPTHPCYCCYADGWWNKRIIGPNIIFLCTLCEASLSFKMNGLTVQEICCTHHGKILHQVNLQND